MSWRWLSLVIVLAACGGDEASAPTASVPGTATEPDGRTDHHGDREHPTTGVVPDGFDTEAAEVTAADGEVCALCLWVAATPDDRERGLMGVTDLGGADGMVFVFGETTQGAFWMRGTPTPLSIAFFADDGSFVSATDMVPCVEGPASDCALYAAAAPYTEAIEVFAGGLDELGIAAGSHLRLLGTPCDPAASSP